jgi:hypothetical protein
VRLKLTLEKQSKDDITWTVIRFSSLSRDLLQISAKFVLNSYFGKVLFLITISRRKSNLGLIPGGESTQNGEHHSKRQRDSRSPKVDSDGNGDLLNSLDEVMKQR